MAGKAGTAVPETPKSGDQDIVRIAARAYEIDRYLAGLLAPLSVQPDLVSLAALAGEIARVPAYVSEPAIGQIRLAWWREQLEAGIAGATTGHPIADHVARLSRRAGLTSATFTPLIEARALELEAAPMANDAALDAYLLDVDGTLFHAGARCLGVMPTEPERALLAQAARCYGLARLLTEAAALNAQGRTLLPVARLAAYGVDPDQVGRADTLAQLRPIVIDLSAVALERYQALRPALLNARREVELAVLPVALVPDMLRRVLAAQRTRDMSPGDSLPIVRITRLWLAARLRAFPAARGHAAAEVQRYRPR